MLSLWKFKKDFFRTENVRRREIGPISVLERFYCCTILRQNRWRIEEPYRFSCGFSRYSISFNRVIACSTIPRTALIKDTWDLLFTCHQFSPQHARSSRVLLAMASVIARRLIRSCFLQKQTLNDYPFFRKSNLGDTWNLENAAADASQCFLFRFSLCLRRRMLYMKFNFALTAPLNLNF